MTTHGGRSARLDDLTGSGFYLIASADADIDGLFRLATPPLARLGGMMLQVTASSEPGPGALQVLERDGIVAGWFAANGCTAALVRPDHYVFGAADTENMVELLGGIEQRLQQQASGSELTISSPGAVKT